MTDTGIIIQTLLVCNGWCRDDGTHCPGCLSLRATGTTTETRAIWEVYCNETGRHVADAYIAYPKAAE